MSEAHSNARRYKAPLPPCRGEELLEFFKIMELKPKILIAATDRLRRHRWRILIIDREFPRQLIIQEDPREYTEEECRAQLNSMIALDGGTIKKPVRAFGILGFIRLVESYHMAIIERRRSVGRLLGHEIFALEHVSFIQVYSGKMPEDSRNHEIKYIKYLSDSNLTSPCFFSYSLDLTRTLQSNMGGSPAHAPAANPSMYCWNHHLLHGGGFHRRLRNKQWGVALICGYFEQRTIPIRGSCTNSVTLTLVARRSRHFAGTRYLKRGLTSDGFVANHVETEHILSSHAGLGRSLSDVLHSAYVQVRGSVPLFWSQMSDAMVPKPQVFLHKYDPMYCATRKHLAALVVRYGAPLLLLDLLKLQEKAPREIKLGCEYREAIRCLGVTVAQPQCTSSECCSDRCSCSSNVIHPLGDKACLVQWDFADNKKNKPDAFRARLLDLSTQLVLKTGFFCSDVGACVGGGRDVLERVGGCVHATGREQRGVIRTNCVDCLDRTNCAQEYIAQVALALQMSAHGHHTLLHDLDCTDHTPPHATGAVGQHLHDMYNLMGDALAQHYAGTSAHKKTVEGKPAAAAEKLKSIMVSINRYYRNSFTDQDKQRALDLFHGVFRAPPASQINAPDLWDVEIETLEHQHQRANTQLFPDKQTCFDSPQALLHQYQAAPGLSAHTWGGGPFSPDSYRQTHAQEIGLSHDTYVCGGQPLSSQRGREGEGGEGLSDESAHASAYAWSGACGGEGWHSDDNGGEEGGGETRETVAFEEKGHGASSRSDGDEYRVRHGRPSPSRPSHHAAEHVGRRSPSGPSIGRLSPSRSRHVPPRDDWILRSEQVFLSQSAEVENAGERQGGGEEEERRMWREHCFSMAHEVDTLTSFDELMKSCNNPPHRWASSFPSTPPPSQPPFAHQPPTSCSSRDMETERGWDRGVHLLAGAVHGARVHGHSTSTHSIFQSPTSWPWLYTDTGPHVRTLNPEHFRHFVVGECVEGVQVDLSACYRLNYFTSDHPLLTEVLQGPERYGWGSPGSENGGCGGAEGNGGVVSSKQSELMTEHIRCYYSFETDTGWGEEGVEKERVDFAGGQSQEGCVGWSLTKGPPKTVIKEGKVQKRGHADKGLEGEKGLYIYSRAGEAEKDVYRSSLLLQRLLCEDFVIEPVHAK